MFKIDEDEDLSFLSSEITLLEKNYVIQANDLLDIRVYTNKGEQIIDPNYELQQNMSQNRQVQDRASMLVLEDGSVKFPMIGEVNLGGMQITEAENYLEKKYSDYYKDPFVTLEYLNKRVVVLGAPGGQVIPLYNENTSVVEVVALAGGIDINGKAHNLRLIRGDLHEPQVFLIDLSTVAGMRSSMMNALPGDIIYIEPTRKIVTEGAKHFMTIFAIVVNTITLYYLIVNINNITRCIKQ